MDKTIVLATRNQKKVKEMQDLLASLLWRVVSVAQFPDAPEVEEDGKTFAENALKKARTIAEALGLPALADDSGLEVDALDGAPGVYSARYAGVGATDEDNWRKLLDELKGIPLEKRTARFRCVLAFVRPGEEPVLAEGTCEGVIIHQPAGDGGFGYDPVFFLPDAMCTMAQLSAEEKNRRSHRGQAMRALLAKLREGEA